MKSPIYQGIFQSDMDATGYKLTGLHTPTASSDAATKGYVDAHSGGGGGGTDRKFDVMTYGAIGDGTTDDTTAIQDALADIPSTGGVLYCPAGIYKYAGSTLVLDRKVTVEGDGGLVQHYNATTALHVAHAPAISTIDFDNPTGTLFQVDADGCTFKNILLRNPNGTTPSAGAGILVASHGDRTLYRNISVDGFYIDVDVQAGSGHTFYGCVFKAPVLYALKLRNILVPDGGDHQITDCAFVAPENITAMSAIRIESGGGPKFVNCKINNTNFSHLWSYGIDLAVGNSVNTADLLVSNCSIEGYSVAGIRGVTGSSSLWRNSVICGNQFQAFGSANPRAIHLAGTSAGDFNGWTITGNWAENIGTVSANSMIELSNCSNMVVTGNGQLNFASTLALGSGVTMADSPVYIGRDARLVSISGGVKLQVRNTSTGVWVDGDQWTNP